MSGCEDEGLRNLVHRDRSGTGSVGVLRQSETLSQQYAHIHSTQVQGET